MFNLASFNSFRTTLLFSNKPSSDFVESNFEIFLDNDEYPVTYKFKNLPEEWQDKAVILYHKDSTNHEE